MNGVIIFRGFSAPPSPPPLPLTCHFKGTPPLVYANGEKKIVPRVPKDQDEWGSNKEHGQNPVRLRPASEIDDY